MLRAIPVSPFQSVGIIAYPTNSCQTFCISFVGTEVLIVQFFRCVTLAACSEFHSTSSKVVQGGVLAPPYTKCRVINPARFPFRQSELPRFVSYVTLGSFPSKLCMLPCSSDYIIIHLGCRVLRGYLAPTPCRDSRCTFLIAEARLRIDPCGCFPEFSRFHSAITYRRHYGLSVQCTNQPAVRHLPNCVLLHSVEWV